MISGRYSRQVLFEPIGRVGQKKLGGSSVVIIGCGALGTVIADRLVRAGVGAIRIVDRDFVELDNLQRQALFTEEHAHLRLPKAVAAGSVLKTVNSEVEVEPVVCDITPGNVERVIEGCDIVMDATDNLETRFLMNDACLKAGIPWIHGAAVGSCGQEMPIIPGVTACYRCLIQEPPTEPLQGCDVLGVLNTVTGIIADIQSTHAIQLLTDSPVPYGTLTFIDVWENEFERFVVDRVPDCPACVRGEYSYLKKETVSWSTSLCGRNAVQISPAREMLIDLEGLAASLSRLGRVDNNGYLLALSIDGYEVTVFPNGRAIIKGTTDTKIARTLYSRYIGF
ncbi:MAG: ThiF family adenylyltransferase [Actinomycetia bacterium]|nr:ThiF family adenylyltransferase [Actinomycetes bacterium]